MLRIHSRLDYSYANGPGLRACTWLQGCQGMMPTKENPNAGCVGCWNATTHNPENWNFLEDPIELSKYLLKLDVDGYTFSGGEPLQQYEDLLVVCKYIRTYDKNISIGIYTGYTLEEVHKHRYSEILYYLDFAVMGRYNESKTNDKPQFLLGSSNQKLHLFSTKHTLSDFSESNTEFQITDTGLIQITGFPTNLNLGIE